MPENGISWLDHLCWYHRWFPPSPHTSPACASAQTHQGSRRQGWRWWGRGSRWWRGRRSGGGEGWGQWGVEGRWGRVIYGRRRRRRRRGRGEGEARPRQGGRQQLERRPRWGRRWWRRTSRLGRKQGWGLRRRRWEKTWSCSIAAYKSPPPVRRWRKMQWINFQQTNSSC